MDPETRSLLEGVSLSSDELEEGDEEENVDLDSCTTTESDTDQE